MTSSDEPLRIGIFTDDFYPESGGVSRSIQLQLQELSRAGHHVTLFAPRVHFTPPAECAWVGLPSWRLPGAPSYLCSLQTGPRLAARLAAEHRLDVVHSQNERGSVFLAAQVARIAGIPQVHTFHSNYVGTHLSSPIRSRLNSISYLDWSSRLLARISDRRVRPEPSTAPQPRAESRFAARDWRSLARIAGAVDAFTSPASYLIDSIQSFGGPALDGRGSVIASGVADTFRQAVRQRPREAPIRFLSCGRLSPEKRIDQILTAFDLLGRDDIELHIVGSGVAAAGLRQQAARIRRGQIRFLGHFDDTAAIAAEFADADVFVFASYRFDTQGMVLAEAAAAGTAIVYCDDRLEIGVSPENSILTDPDPASLAAGMAAIIADRDELERRSAASRAIGAELTLEAMAEAYLLVYRSAIRARKAR